MNKLSMIASAGVLSVVVAGSVVSPALAWHPKGVITKSVQNVTTAGPVSAADTETAAGSAKPGDVLNYVIEVKNVAAPAQKQYNDMAFTVMTDTLPAGVELISSPSTRVLKENMGTILPGKSKRVEYKVKVTATTDGTVVTNKACFAADSVVKDNPQKGCDNAVVKVSVPSTPVTPEEPEQPVPTPVQPETLPAAGANMFAPLAALLSSALGYVGHLAYTKRRMA